ncbi:MFS transporter [Streptomyces sp. I3(2020)]|nr:MFS transporter [Streptomyces sp. I3(2020)]
MPLPVLAMMLCTFCIGTAESVIAGILPGIAQDVGVSLTAVGLLITVYAVAVVMVGPWSPRPPPRCAAPRFCPP